MTAHQIWYHPNDFEIETDDMNNTKQKKEHTKNKIMDTKTRLYVELDAYTYRPLPINHRPIAINMQCNKIPFIAYCNMQYICRNSIAYCNILQ